ncbi:Proline-, glutamic acid- and leucine-rich protein 1 [Haplosporangium sp. Z 767]|nr:Proline-, glutamic acid- and leucine-rich protein 1 [Haplosporangium sp. Z 767]
MAFVVQATPANLLDTLINRYLKAEIVKDYVPFVLESITHHNLLHNRYDQPAAGGQQSTQHRIWVTRLRALLESTESGQRWAGACYVRITAQQSVSMFSDHVRTWVTLLVGLLSKETHTATLDTIIETLSELFAKMAKRPDLKSDVTSKLPEFHNHLLDKHRSKKDLLPTIFKALTQSVTLFPTTFRVAVDRTEALCVAYMDGRFDLDPGLVHAAATCFAALHCAGGKNPNHPTERITPSEQWRGNVQEIIKAMHRCLNILFSTVDEDKADQNEMAGRNKYLINMPEPSADAIQRYPQLFGRFSSLSKALIACLICPTKESVHLPLNNLVALLTRIFNVNAKTPMSDARGIDQQEYFILISGIASVHLSANEILKTLLATAQDHLVRHMAHLASIVIKSVRHSFGTSSSLRSSTYSVVDACIQAFGIPFVNMVQVPLMAALLDDLRMPSARVVNPLEMGAPGGANPNSRANNHTNTTKHKGGAGKNRRGNNNQVALSSLNPLEEIVSAQVFTAALSILSLVLTTSGPNLPPHARAAADTLIVTHILNCQHHVNPIEQSETPFYSAPVRAQLYKTLVASISSPGETQSSLVPLSVGIFKAGLSDTEQFVRDNCTMALTICDLVMHSRLPPMQRARTVVSQSDLAKGEKPVQDTGSALFGAFEVSKSGKDGKVETDSASEDDSEEEEEEEEEKDADGSVSDVDQEQDTEDIEMQDTPTTTSSMAAFKAAGSIAAQPLAVQEQETVSTTTTSVNVQKENIQDDSSTNSSSVSYEVTKMVSSSSVLSTTNKAAATMSSSATTTSTTTTIKASSSQVSTVATSNPSIMALDGGDDDEEIPDINMDDDDDDDDMDSD